ncbi:hypothetical protein L2V81_14850 [Proteus terrae]|nr:hypothetical protein [Proteus terrae]
MKSAFHGDFYLLNIITDSANALTDRRAINKQTGTSIAASMMERCGIVIKSLKCVNEDDALSTDFCRLFSKPDNQS